MELSPGTVIAGRYTIERKIGGGGMGVVHRARDAKFGSVALKLAAASGAALDEFRRRFEREARLGNELGRLQGIVRALDWGELPERGSLYLVMDLVADARSLDLAGGSLRERLERLRTAARIVERVHAAGVIHRDLKPANFLQETNGTIWLTDFGLAKSKGSAPESPGAHHSLSLSGVGFGTPGFMPPEQFHDAKNADERADVYALGVMLFATLTGGRLPFEGAPATIVRLQDRVLDGREPLPLPRRHDSTVPEELDALCARAIALDKDKRLATVGAFVAGLTSFLEPLALTLVEPPSEVGGARTAAPLETLETLETLEPLEPLETVEPLPDSTPVTPRSAGPLAPSPLPTPAPSPEPPAPPPPPSHRGCAKVLIAALIGLGLLAIFAHERLDWLNPNRRSLFDLDPEPSLAPAPWPTPHWSTPPSPAAPSPAAPSPAAPSPTGPTPTPAVASALAFESLVPEGNDLTIDDSSLDISGKLSDPTRGPVWIDAAPVTSWSVDVDAEGRFEAHLHLAPGERRFTVMAGDGALQKRFVVRVDVSKKLAELDALEADLGSRIKRQPSRRLGVFEPRWWRLASHRGLAEAVDSHEWWRHELDAFLCERLEDDAFAGTLRGALSAAGSPSPPIEAAIVAARLAHMSTVDNVAVRTRDFTEAEKADLLRRSDAPGKHRKLREAVGVLLDSVASSEPAKTALLELVAADLAKSVPVDAAQEEEDRRVTLATIMGGWSALPHPEELTRAIEAANAAKEAVESRRTPALENAFAARFLLGDVYGCEAVVHYAEARARLDEAIVAAASLPCVRKDPKQLAALEFMYPVSAPLARRRLAIQGDVRALRLDALADLLGILASAERAQLENAEAQDDASLAEIARKEARGALLRELGADQNAVITLVPLYPVDLVTDVLPEDGWASWDFITAGELEAARSEERVVRLDDREFVLPTRPAAAPASLDALRAAHALEPGNAFDLPPSTIEQR